MIRKKGYKPLLGATVLFTLTGFVMLMISFWENPVVQGPAAPLGVIIPTFLAGFTCVVRKRWFTE